MMDAVKIQPWSPEPAVCRKCGSREHIPVTIGDGLMFGSTPPMATVYCPGGQEPEQEDTNPITAMLNVVSKTGAIPGGLGDGMSKKRINICAGIGKEHLHRICGRCQYEWLTQTKDGPAG